MNGMKQGVKMKKITKTIIVIWFMIIISVWTVAEIDLLTKYEKIKAKEYYYDCSSSTDYVVLEYEFEIVKVPMKEFCKSFEWLYSDEITWKKNKKEENLQMSESAPEENNKEKEYVVGIVNHSDVEIIYNSNEDLNQSFILIDIDSNITTNESKVVVTKPSDYNASEEI